jgi:hypothetical protein
MISKKALKKAWDTTKKGYGKSVSFTKKYAPIAEQRFRRMAQTTTDAFRPVQMDVKPDFRVPRSDIDFGRPRPMKRRKRHDFGSLSFDLG